MEYELRFKGNDIRIYYKNKLFLRCKRSGFIFKYKFGVYISNKLILEYNYYSFFGFEKFKLNHQELDKLLVTKKTKNGIELFYDDKRYYLKQSFWGLSKYFAELFIDKEKNAIVKYDIMKAPRSLYIDITKFDLISIVCLVINCSHLDGDF